MSGGSVAGEDGWFLFFNTRIFLFPVQATLPSDSLGIAHLIRAYQVNGHRSANLDPLGLHSNESFPFRPGNVRSRDDLDDGYADTLNVGFHGFTEKDMDRELNLKGVHTGGNKGYLADLTSMPGKITLRSVRDSLPRFLLVVGSDPRRKVNHLKLLFSPKRCWIGSG